MKNKIDRTVITYEFLRDISNHAERIFGKKLGLEAAEEAYITFKKNINKKLMNEGKSPLNDSEIMNKIDEDKDFYELSMKLIISQYKAKRFL